MKKLSIICTIILAVGMMSSAAFATSYCIDIAPTSKTFADVITLNESDTVTIDVYINDIRTGDILITGGFEVPYYSGDRVEILSVTAAPGWDSAMTVVDTSTPNYLFVGVGNLSGNPADAGNDVKICTLTMHCLAFGPATMVFMPDPSVDMIVSAVDSFVYDGIIAPKDFTFDQIRCCDIDADCDDGIYCNGLEYCVPDPVNCPTSTGKCMRAVAIDCDDPIDCTVDACNEDTDSCDNIPTDALCDDSVGCTVDACDQLGAPGTGCSNTPVDAACDDANVCTDDSCDATLDCLNVANSDPCDDGLYCNGTDTCSATVCSLHTGDPCDDANVCSDDTCTEATELCTNVCNASSAVDVCCEDAVCDAFGICAAGGAISIGDWWANCGDVGVKIDICLQNLEIPVGGFQIDLCEDIGDCLVCTECELTERTVIFDCMVNELENGCCRVILFAKHPGGLINPGECNIVRIVYEIRDIPECCDTCIGIDGENIVLSDEYGYDRLGVVTDTGQVCPYVCGDVWPPQSALGEMDCGDGVIDLFDILEEISFALGAPADAPDACQCESLAAPGLCPRADVPTGTPIILPAQCLDPDLAINILDVMVLIDMALGRQDCCSYYYAGIII